MRGPINSPAAIRLRQPSTSAKSLPMSRTPVIPLATNSGSESTPVLERWTWASQSPGMRNFCLPLMTRALFGTDEDTVPIERIRPPSMTTLRCVCTLRSRGLITVTSEITTGWQQQTAHPRKQ